MTDHLLANTFAEHIELHSIAGAELTHSIMTASEKITYCLLTDKKVLTFGNSSSHNIAKLTSDHLVNGYGIERPALPAMNVDSTKQLSALGQSEDSLLLFASDTANEEINAIITTAHERNLSIVLCTNSELHAEYLGPTDTAILLPVATQLRHLELQLTISHCLCQLIDNQIFGEL